MAPSESPAGQTKLVIDLDDGEDTEDLKTLLRLDPTTRQNIVKVRVESSWDDIEEWIDSKTLPTLFDCLGKLENLQQLHLNLGCGISLHVSWLAKLLQQSPRLQVLCLDSVALMASGEDDVKMLAQTVCQTALSCVCLSDVQMQYQGAEAESLHHLEPFLVSLSQSCPTMRVLEIEDVPISAAAIRTIGSSTHLKDVELWNIPAVGEYISDFATALQSNDTLQEIELCNCAIGPQGGEILTEMLVQNTTLTSVVLDIDWGAQIMFGKPIASILKSNQTLTSLHLICRQEDRPTQYYAAEDYAQMICQSLAHNPTLQRLALEFRQSRTSRNDNSRLAAAFTEPLKEALIDHNCTLQEFALTGGRSFVPIVWKKDVSFYLGLNKAGRKEWMGGANQQGWMETLIQHKDDLSTSFYFMSLYPHLLGGSF